MQLTNAMQSARPRAAFGQGQGQTQAQGQPGAPVLSLEAMMHCNFLFLGDSHIAYFRQAMQLLGFLSWQYQFCEAGVATGIDNGGRQSATNAFETFHRFLRDKNRQSTVVLQLGEAVCSFVIWHRAMLYGEAVSDQLRASISAYVTFIHDIRRAGFIDIVITGATLPTIREGEVAGAAAAMRREVTATLAERTKLTLDYNRALQTNARELGLRYLDISADLIDPATKTVRSAYLNPDPCDHHLDYNAAGQLWADRLRLMIAAESSRRRLPAA